VYSEGLSTADKQSGDNKLVDILNEWENEGSNELHNATLIHRWLFGLVVNL